MLRVWLPLTKDLRQQGLSNVTVTNNGATYSSTGGKLGGCYSFNGSSYIDTNYGNGLSVNNKTIACWFKPTADCANDVVFGTLNGSNQRCYVGISNNTYNLAFGTTTYGRTTTASVVTNEWVHIVMTITNNEAKLYVNGTFIESLNNSSSFNLASNIFIGGRSDGYKTNSLINDFRVYDHCLSPMEVKELAKGLVLHYPLDRQGWGQENLLVDTYNWSTLTSTNTVSEGYWYSSGGIAARRYDNINNITYCKIWHGNSSSWTCYSRQYITMQPNTYYTVSILCRINTDIAHLSIRNDRNAAITFFVQNVELTNKNWEWKFFTAKTHADTSQEPFTIYAQVNSDGVLSSDTSIDIAMVKLEKGSIATPWCPNSSDTLATTMGLNSTTEYDCSGFCNNGTRIGTFTWTSNTPKYAVSQVFNGSDNAIQTPNLTTMVTDKNYTVACWTYKTVIGTKNYQTIYGGPSGFELEARSSSSTSPLYRIHNWGGGTTAYNFGEWTHFCFVHTDSDSKLYVNGVLKITGSSANVPSGNYFVGAWNTSTSQNYEGNMSDFRIYATALSADDVKSLYQNSAYIDSSGNVYGAVHSEV